jgi:N-formylglutamate deformylase
VHAVQLEMCQSLYMDEEPPFAWRADLASQSAPAVRACVEGALGRLQAIGRRTGAAILAG